jgi:hypothetical protein
MAGEGGLLAWSLGFNGGQPPDLRIRLMIMGDPSLQKALVYERVKNTQFGLKQGPITDLVSGDGHKGSTENSKHIGMQVT